MELAIGGRRAAVAGASSGLGFAVAAALATEGVHVAICGRDRDRIERAAAEIGSAVVPIVCDVSTGEGGRQFETSAQDALGGLDILVANGGGPPVAGFADATLEAYRAAIELSLVSVIGMCQVAVPPMLEAGWGRVVAITSITVRQPAASMILSNTARAGTTGFLKTLALELAGRGVTVNSVQPGPHATERVESLMGKLDPATFGIRGGVLGRPADFGAAVAWLCSDQARFTTGVQLHVDGGSYGGLQ